MLVYQVGTSFEMLACGKPSISFSANDLFLLHGAFRLLEFDFECFSNMDKFIVER